MDQRKESFKDLKNDQIEQGNSSINQIYKTELRINLQPNINQEISINHRKCSKCFNEINEKEILEFNNRFYHWNCFNCSICHRNLKRINSNERFLLDEIGDPICFDCQLEKAELCSKCDQQILQGKRIDFQKKLFHWNCFNCQDCQKSLVNQRNVQFYSSNPSCIQCYQKYYSPKCFKCSQSIFNEKYTTWNENKYHLQCFRCDQCDQIITDSKFHLINDKFRCKECYLQFNAPKCFQCQQIISDQNYSSFNGQTYHSNCFRCDQCRRIISSSEKFSKTERNILCLRCQNN